MLVTILLALGGFMFVLGTLIFLIDAIKVHWGWAFSMLCPPVALFFCFKHWHEMKRGFILSLIGVPVLAAGLAMRMDDKSATAQTKVNDPFANAMNKAREAVAAVQKQRSEITPPGAITPETVTAQTAAPALIPKASSPSAAPVTTPIPAPTIAARLAANRAKFKQLALDFDALNSKRKSLPKNDLKAIGLFNQEAKAYADNLAAARSEQEDLLALEKMGSH